MGHDSYDARQGFAAYGPAMARVRTETADRVTTVTIDRPPLNLLSLRLQEELTWAFDTFTDRDDVRVAVLTGAGKNFCTGIDLKKRLGDPEPGEAWANQRSWRECTYSMMECRKPVIAAIHGYALAGGSELALACDLRVAAEGSVFGLPEVAVAIIPGAGGVVRLPRLIGTGKARERLVTGRRVQADEAERIVLIDRLVPLADLDATVHEIADQISQNAPRSVRAVKRALRNSEGLP